MNTPEKPVEGADSDTDTGPATSSADGAGQRRRRGSRGGRRHKTAAPAAADEHSAPVAANKRSTPPAGARRRAASPAALELPTAPLVPVVGETVAGPAASPPDAAPAITQHQAPDDGESRSSSRTASRSTTRRRRKASAQPGAAPAATPSADAVHSTAHAADVTATDDGSSAAPAVAFAPAAASHAAAASKNAPRTVAEPVVTPADGEEGAADTGADNGQDGGEPAAKRRRRGNRGGRRRNKNTDAQHAEAAPEVQEADGEPPRGDEAAEPPHGDGAVDSSGQSLPAPDQVTSAAAEADRPAAAPERSAASTRRPRDRRRPKAIVRQDEGSGLATGMPVDQGQRRTVVVAERPERKIILVSDDGQELRVALVEDGRLSEIYIERPDHVSYLGDIYQGKVENVMSGIDAAFVDFGLEKNGFLYVDEVTAPEGERRARHIKDALKNGQQVLVQVIKDPMGHKGARLSTKLSLAGRYLVYVPGSSGVGVSRRLNQGERDRLRDISRELKPKNAGLIVRTIAEGHGLDDLKRDLQYLSRLWSRLKKKAERVAAPGLVHKEVDVSLEVTRDLFNDTCESLIVDDPKRHKAIVSLLTKGAPELLPKVHLYTGEEPLFNTYGIEEQIARALERRVPLPSGGNLMIDHAEALTVIDVNTGRFTRGKGLEDTITKTNIEAAKEVVRQLRLRDIGGIIIIDFIDMAHARNRELVLATLEAELETDRTKTYVVELSPLGLVEMTRQNTTDGARGILTRACPYCQGKARVLSDETMALSVERRVRALARKSQAKAWLVELNSGVAARLQGARLKRLEKQTGRRVFLEGCSALPVDSFRVIAEGSVASVQEQRVPVREGQEVTVELEFSLTYSPRDAVGYIDGYMIIVEGGRQHVGRRRKVRIIEIARSGARATLLKKEAKKADDAEEQ